MIISLALGGTNGTNATAAFTIITGSTPGRARLLELGYTNGAATASTYDVGRPAANGTTPTSPVDFLVEDPADVLASGVVQACTAWTTAPTAPTAAMRRVNLAATIGGGMIWTFPKGIVIPVSGNFVIYNKATNSAVYSCYAVIDL